MSNDASDAGLVVAAGGASARFGQTNKLLGCLGNEPVFVHCLRRLATVVPAKSTVLVVPAEERDTFAEALQRAGLDVRLVAGGPSRPESVLAGLRALPATVTIAAVQDAARPFTSPELLQSCLDSTRAHGSGVAAHAVVDTIKTVDEQDFVLTTPNRAQLRATETPQVFPRADLEDAYEFCISQGIYPSDEAQAIEALNKPVHLVVHDQPNPKLTYASDLPLFSYLLNAENTP